MQFNDGFFGGMHLIWWIVWIIVLVWIFFIPFHFSFLRSKKEVHLDFLRKRFASGEINKEQFEAAKKILKTEN